MRQPRSSASPIPPPGQAHHPPPGRRRERPNLTERVRLWRAFWLYLAVAWLAAGALIELQPLTQTSITIRLSRDRHLGPVRWL